MAHLLEHMMFKGSPKCPDILAAIRSRGAQFNGTTSWDRTNYFETFDASDANLEWALDLEADRMVNAVRRAEATSTREMTVVRNEFERGENEPDRRAVRARAQHRVLVAQLRQLADRQPQRHRERADRAPAGVLQAALPARQRGARRRRHASRSSRRSTLIERRVRRDPAADARCSSHYTDRARRRTASAKSSCGASATCRFSSRAITRRPAPHEDFVPLQLAAEVLGDEPSGRLYKALVEPGLASQIGVRHAAAARPGMVLFLAIVREDASLDASARRDDCACSTGSTRIRSRPRRSSASAIRRCPASSAR